MKRIATFLAFTIVISFIIISCSKDGGSSNNNSDIVGKWYQTKFRQKESDSATNRLIRDTTITFTDSSYSDFRTDGKVYSYSSTQGRDTSSYNYSGNVVTVTSGTNVVKNTVQTLDAHNLVGYKTYYSNSLKWEEWITYVK